MLAYSLFVSLTPLALGVLSIFGLVNRSPRRFANLRQIIVQVFPPDVQAPVREALLAASQHAVTIIVVSLLGLAWFSTGLFSTSGFALNQIYRFPHRTFWQQRLRGLWLAVALIGAVGLVVFFEVAVRLAGLPPVAALGGVWFALGMLILFLYRMAPGRRLARSQLWPGAAAAALGIVLFGYVLSPSTHLTLRLGTDTRFFAEVFALAAWVYFIAQAILFGAVFNRCLAQVRATSIASQT